MGNEDEILARIRRVSTELSHEALSISRPFLARLLEMAAAEAKPDGDRQSPMSHSGDIQSNPSSDVPNTGTETPVVPFNKCR